MSSPTSTRWRTLAVMLMIMAFAMQIAFATWWTLIKNYAVEDVGFSGREVGFQESIREIPGFLAFLVIYLLFFMREQTLALGALAVLAIGVVITGWFPSATGLYRPLRRTPGAERGIYRPDRRLRRLCFCAKRLGGGRPLCD